MNYKIFTLLICLSLVSCGGTRTFHEYARAGDTIAIPVGMQADFNKDNITVTITPSIGTPIILDASDPAIRAIINFYPDPVSNMIVSREIDEDLTPYAKSYADATLFTTNNDKDYFQTTVFLDLPLTLPEGLTEIQVANTSGTQHMATLDIISGTGIANSFTSNFNDGLLLNENMLDSLSRSSHTTISLTSDIIPHAVEILFTHDPEITIECTGKAFVINPLGYRKNLTWVDDGINLKVIMLQSNDGIINNMNDYKFYIAGTTTNLQLVSVQGYDINGNDVTGVSSTLTPSN